MFNRWRLAKGVSVAALAVVLTGGAASASTLRASDGHSTGSRHHGRDHRGSEGVFGTVASVNGTTTTGDFTLNAEHNKTFTVDVSTTTKFAGHGLSTPSFADVCVGGRVGAFGLISSGTVTATAVFVTPAVTSPPHHASFVPSQVSSPEGSSKVSQQTDHFQGRQGGSGSGARDGSNSSGNTSGHHHG